MDELTKGTATSGSQKESAIFFNLKLPFKQALKIQSDTIPKVINKKYLSLFMFKSLTFGKCKKNIETKKGDV
jgi:hypothetical protein